MRVMGTKTASIRLEKELFDKIDEHCVTKNCSRNDFVKSAIASALNKKDDDVDHESYHDKFGNRPVAWLFDKHAVARKPPPTTGNRSGRQYSESRQRGRADRSTGGSFRIGRDDHVVERQERTLGPFEIRDGDIVVDDRVDESAARRGERPSRA